MVTTEGELPGAASVVRTKGKGGCLGQKHLLPGGVASTRVLEGPVREQLQLWGHRDSKNGWDTFPRDTFMILVQSLQMNKGSWWRRSQANWALPLHWDWFPDCKVKGPPHSLLSKPGHWGGGREMGSCGQRWMTVWKTSAHLWVKFQGEMVQRGHFEEIEYKNGLCVGSSTISKVLCLPDLSLMVLWVRLGGCHHHPHFTEKKTALPHTYTYGIYSMCQTPWRGLLYVLARAVFTTALRGPLEEEVRHGS